MEHREPEPERGSRDLIPGNPGADPLPWPTSNPHRSDPGQADPRPTSSESEPAASGAAPRQPGDREPSDRGTGDRKRSDRGQSDREAEQLAADQLVLEELQDQVGPGRRGLRDTLSLLVTRLTAAEREMRSAEEATIASNRAAAAAAGQRENREFSAFKTGFFGGVGLLLAYMTYLSLDTIRSTLIVIAVAALLAIGLDPAVGWVMRRGLRRGGAVAVVFLSLVAVIAGAVYAIFPPIVTQLSAFIGNLPTILGNLQDNPTIKNLDAKFGIIKQIQDSDIVKNVGSGAATGILSGAATLAGIVFDLFVVLILTLYFLSGFPRIKAAGFRLAPATQRVRVTDLGDRVLKQMGGYLSGATIIALQAGLVAGVFSAFVGLPYPWAIALGAALLDFVPVVGPIIVAVSMALIGFTQSLTIGIVAAAFYLCQHLFEAYWLYPRVMRRTVHISSGTVIVAILVGGALLGVTGALLAVPVAAAAQLIVREVVMPIQERR